MPTQDRWWLLVMLYLFMSWLIAYLASGLTSVTRAAQALRTPKPLTPRPPTDCPDCQAQPAPSLKLRPADPPPPPWSHVRSRRGRQKVISTAGYACHHPKGAYRLITDARVHALVADGRHGHDHIRDFRGQACGHKFSYRRDTALYRLRTPSRIICFVLALLAEGMALDALQRVFGIRETTLRLWLTRAGLHAQRLHAHFAHDLLLAHIQLDELCTTTRLAPHDLWLWLALDATTKFIPAFVLGPRTQAFAHQLIHQLGLTLAASPLPVFSSDGLKLYFYALTAHFGHWLQPDGQTKPIWQTLPALLYAQVQKIHRRRRLVRVNRQMLCGSLDAFTARLQTLGLSGCIAHVPRKAGVGRCADRLHRTAQSDRAPLPCSARAPLLESGSIARRTYTPTRVVAGLLSFRPIPYRPAADPRSAPALA